MYSLLLYMVIYKTKYKIWKLGSWELTQEIIQAKQFYVRYVIPNYLKFKVYRTCKNFWIF